MTQEPIVKEYVLNSKCKSGQFKLGTIVEDQLILTIEQTAEEFLKEELGENSVDFKIAQKIIESSDGEIDWTEFLKRADIDNGKVRGMGSLIVDGIDFTGSDMQGEIAEKIARGELNLGVNIKLGGDDTSVTKILDQEKFQGDLNLSDTRLMVWGKLKKLMGHLNLKGMKWLKSIGNLSYIHGDIEVQGANMDLQIDIVRKINNKKLHVDSMSYLGGKTNDLDKLFSEKVLRVGLDLRGTDIKTLGDLEEVKFLILEGLFALESIGNLKKIDGFANFIGLGVKAQKEIIGKMQRGELEIVGIPIFGGFVDGIEELLELGDIPGILSFTDTPQHIQDKFKKTLENEELKVKEYADFDDRIIKGYDQTPYI